MERLKHQNRSFNRSNELQKHLESIGLTDTPQNNKFIREHLLDVGKQVTPDNRVWVPSVIEGPKGKLKVESTWKVLDNGKSYLSTIKFIPMEKK
ncbi:hypothetical protein [Marinibactrum halimedae]|uniref:Uncharacterized protein n=1 Tax=Marinibactrum halimedae TaxID=1444977 RepID=A0AA37T7U6_9GAMM|nr:hypothetical protein [Marinibactrum halimedae]MCD9461391.1 hypothetical protein [Marinibactrum halimedae]GLS27234.1 hypothetical protein GCM10007877_29530 [Marinibactrum halimedae]